MSDFLADLKRKAPQRPYDSDAPDPVDTTDYSDVLVDRRQSAPLSSAFTALSAADRPLPHNSEAETAVLSAVMLEGVDQYRLLARFIQDPEDFYHPAHAELWTTFRELLPEGTIDLIAVATKLEERGKLEACGGKMFLSQVLSASGTAANSEHYAKIVAEDAAKRRIIRTSVELQEKAYDGQTKSDLLEHDLLTLTRSLTERHPRQYRMIGDVIIDTIAEVEAAAKHVDTDETGIRTTMNSLRPIVPRLRMQNMSVLAARPSVGKTALFLSMAAGFCARGVPVGMASIEMPGKDVILRMLCQRARVNVMHVAEGKIRVDEWPRLIQAAEQLRDYPFFIDDDSYMTPNKLRGLAAQMKRDHDIKLLGVDYLQLMHGDGRFTSREQEIAHISGELKALAKDLNIHVMALAQLNRQADDGVPKLRHLRESGAIEQDADLVLLLHRDDNGAEADLYIGKHRNGPQGKASLVFHRESTAFDDRSRIADEDVPELTY